MPWVMCPWRSVLWTVTWWRGLSGVVNSQSCRILVAALSVVSTVSVLETLSSRTQGAYDAVLLNHPKQKSLRT